MTGANRVSSLYASVAEAGHDTGSEPLRAAPSGSERDAASDTTLTLRGVAGPQDGAASRAPRRGKGAEQAVDANPRQRTAAAAPGVSRKVLLRRAALAGAAIVLLGLGLTVSEESAPVPVLVLGASTADGGGQSGDGDNSAGTSGTRTTSVTDAASADAAAQPEAGLVGAAPTVHLLGSTDEGAPQIVASQGETALAAGAPTGTARPATTQPAPAHATAQGTTAQGTTAQGTTAQGTTAQSTMAQTETAQTETGLAGPGASTAVSPGGTPASHSDVVTPGVVPNSGTRATTSGLPAAVAQRDASRPSVAPAPSSESARALAAGYVVQLGVFGDPENAEILSRELVAHGYPAHLQSRVVLGPFADRQAAKAAAERLRGERKLDSLVVPPRKP